MISREREFVFIHIPKTAGTSIEKLVGHFETLERGAQDHRTVRELMRVTLPELASVSIRESPVQAARELRGVLRYPQRISRDEFERFYKFTFVRNPWARVYSWFKNVTRDPLHQQKRGIAPDCTLYRFLTEFGGQSELRTQLDWIRDRRGRIAMDFIGRFESLERDMRQVCGRLGMESSDMPHLVAGGGKQDYRDHYDDASRKHVAERYSEEIAMFGYTFENGGTD